MPPSPPGYLVVRFVGPIEGWPGGTEGTVVLVHDPRAMLVGVSDDSGRTLDFVDAPAELLEVTWTPGTSAAA